MREWTPEEDRLIRKKMWDMLPGWAEVAAKLGRPADEVRGRAIVLRRSRTAKPDDLAAD